MEDLFVMAGVPAWVLWAWTHWGEIVAWIGAVHAVALVIVNLTPTPKDDEFLAKYYGALEKVAGIISKVAKQPSDPLSRSVLGIASAVPSAAVPITTELVKVAVTAPHVAAAAVEIAKGIPHPAIPNPLGLPDPLGIMGK